MIFSSRSRSSPPESFDAVVAFPAMQVGVRTDGEQVCEIAYLPPGPYASGPKNRLAERAVTQLERYQTDPDFRFDLPFALSGTEFRRRVWQAISAIARGKTLTYGEMAKALRSAPRAVGQACGDNPVPLLIPCHRVVGAAGIGGFAHHAEGFLIETKRWLLEHEKAL
jgi:methylated-DNA-[protein]-cysteine S-methyltransferase